MRKIVELIGGIFKTILIIFRYEIDLIFRSLANIFLWRPTGEHFVNKFELIIKFDCKKCPLCSWNVSVEARKSQWRFHAELYACIRFKNAAGSRSIPFIGAFWKEKRFEKKLLLFIGKLMYFSENWTLKTWNEQLIMEHNVAF